MSSASVEHLQRLSMSEIQAALEVLDRDGSYSLVERFALASVHTTAAQAYATLAVAEALTGVITVAAYNAI